MSDPLAISVEDGGEVKVEVKSPAVVAQDSVTPAQGFLDIDTPNTHQSQQLKELWDYVSEDTELESERLYRIQQLEIKLGQPKLGQSRLERLYRYIVLDRQIKADEKLRDGMLR